MNLFNSRPRADLESLARIKAWAASVLGLAEDVAVLVTELRCTEEGCPPLETVIAVLDTPGQPRQFKIHKALAAVTEDDVVQVASGKTCDHHQENHP
jgi:hypothetical protein